MYAVIRAGGKQYRVHEGQTLRVEALTAEPGATVEFDQVLMVGEGGDVQIGAPYLEGGKVTAEVLDHGRGRKVTTIRFKRRQKYRRKIGHRQPYTQVKITGISA